MKFYIGMHLPYLAKHFDNTFISVNVLRKRKSAFGVNNWIMDSGAFTEISTYGHYRASVHDYAEQILKWRSCGNLELAVAQDYMCEPFILKITGLTVREHQELTIKRYAELVRDISDSVQIMPVIQGFAPSDYSNHLDMYDELLKQNMRVGVGSVCKRNSKPTEIVSVLETIKAKRPDLKLHGFGLKTTALKNNYISSLLYSADSMAWSFAARKQHRNPNGLTEAKEFEMAINAKMSTTEHQFILI
jgi:hypothetical protein